MDDVCVNYRSELSALIDGQLDQKLQTEVQSHLTACESCSQELGTLRSLNEFIVQNIISENLVETDVWEKLQASLPSLCEVVRSDLSAFIDSELSAQAQDGLDKHLRECSPCMVTFKELSATCKLISKHCELLPSVKIDLWPAVKARLNADCALIKSELSAYADQEVENLRHRAITGHLADCLDCKESFAHISSVGEVLRDSFKPDIVEPFDIWPDVKRKLQVVPITLNVDQSSADKQAQEHSKNPRKNPRLFLLSAAAIAVLTLASSALLTNFNKPKVVPLSSEAYLIESAMSQPAEIAEAVVYDQQE